MLVMSTVPSCVAQDAETRFMEGIKWQSEDDTAVRRSILLRMYVRRRHVIANLMLHRLSRLIVLKQKCGKVDARISNVARRAELALYTRAHSRNEYGNPRSLCKRLHALIVKLYAHQNNVATKLLKQRPTMNDDAPSIEPCAKRRCAISMTNSDMLLFDGHEGVLRVVTSFLDTSSLIALSSTTYRARHFIPQCVTALRLSASKLPSTPVGTWLRQFPNVESLTLIGDNRFGYGEIAMEHIDMRSNASVEWLLEAMQAAMPLPRLRSLSFQHVYCDGLDDPFTSRVAALVPTLPSLQHLNLVGNCITDVGAVHLANTNSSLVTLNVNNNFIGERGVFALQSIHKRCRVTMTDNLVHMA
ncbi:hypothetical protein DYB28_011577 [Aphanomyces astaci]|uniref:Uncharacterized protein n=1 Tax=Aphanomyces astaci TaxID=112090 RepID=A0A396ZZ11_APHAT|nr:hypothetical protein DYB25_004183 [Aphanomyces astaci]RHY13743.1 hypothetical protein DYB36_007273 [Aphanomyces astaci]RLN99329.1 hypothetical protein DYB28_011577 [Aphanomyces astaci]